MNFLQENFHKYLAKTNPNPYGLTVQTAQGAKIWTKEYGEMYDCTSGIAVNNYGHNHYRVRAAVQDQISRYAHVMVWGELIQENQVQYAKELSDYLSPRITGCEESPAKVWFTNSGTEAVETALKLAWLKNPSYKTFMAVQGGFHGRTTGSLGVTYRPQYRERFKEMLPDEFCYFIKPEEEIEDSGRAVALILECIRGEDGVRPISTDWERHVREYCTKNDVLLIVDEVQTGFGRMGTNFGVQFYSHLNPDILVLGKAVGAGYPLGAVLARREIMELFEEYPFTHLSTFGGHPVSCAAGLAGFNLLRSKELADNSILQGRFFTDYVFSEAPKSILTDIRGMGLMLGLEFGTEELANQFVKVAWEDGLFVGHVLHDNKTVRFYPPLIVNDEEVADIGARALGVMKKL